MRLHHRLSLIAVLLLALCGPAQAQQAQGYHLISTASTNSNSVTNNTTARSAQLTTIIAINTTSTIYYLKFYDVAAAPTCNTSTVVWTIPIPANSSSTGGGVVWEGQSILFKNGIGICLTGAIGDNDNTNAATGVAVNIGFK